MNKLINLKFNLKVIKLEEIGFITFIIGTFLLFSAPLVASIFFNSINNCWIFSSKELFLKDKFNLFLIFVSFHVIELYLISY